MPIGAGLRFDLARILNRNVRLLAIADAGYGFTWLNKNSTGYETKGGWMLNPGLALRVGKPSSSAFLSCRCTYKRQIAEVQKAAFREMILNAMSIAFITGFVFEWASLFKQFVVHLVLRSTVDTLFMDSTQYTMKKITISVIGGSLFVAGYYHVHRHSAIVDTKDAQLVFKSR